MSLAAASGRLFLGEKDAAFRLPLLRRQGIRLGLASNAPFPAEMMLRQIRGNGLSSLLDAVTFSSEIGWRKPSQRFYQTALAKLGTPIEATLFVGDRLLEDFTGPRSMGMQAILYAPDSNPRPEGVEVVSDLRQLVQRVITGGA